MASCPRCGGVYPDPVRICIACGIDLSTGQAISTRIAAPGELDGAPAEGEGAPPLPPPPPSSFAWRFLLLLGDCLPGLFRPAILAAFVLMIALAGFMLYIATWMFFLQTWIAMFMIGGLGVMAYWQGVVWLLSGYFTLLQNGMVEFRKNQWSLFLLIAFAPLAALFAWAMLNRPQ